MRKNPGEAVGRSSNKIDCGSWATRAGEVRGLDRVELPAAVEFRGISLRRVGMV